MMKRLIPLLLLLLTLACSARADTRIMQVSDIHYLSPALFEGSELFLKALASGDGKAAMHSEALLAGLVAEVKHQSPDALIVTGDLSFNGEADSHRALASAFADIEKAGIPVWIIPGNHDINSTPRAFLQDSTRNLTPVSPTLFRSIYADFLGEGDPTSLSYAVDVSPTVEAILLDVSIYADSQENFGLFTKDTLAYLTDAAADAQRKGKQIITCTHQSLLAQSSWMSGSYGIWGGDALVQFMTEQGIHLNLSGHIHVQHHVTDGSVTDAALGAFCNAPHLYAMVTVAEDGAIAYEASPLCAEHLPAGLQDETAAFFRQVTRSKELEDLAATKATPEEQTRMADFAAEANYAYFSGTLTEDVARWTQDDRWTLWEQYGTAIRFQDYLSRVMTEESGDMRRFQLPDVTPKPAFSR